MGDLFGPQRPKVPDLNAVHVEVEQMELKRPRAFGNCWLACEVWDLLGLEGFWKEKLPEGHEGVAWSKAAKLLAVIRLIAPSSEWHLHWQWFDLSAMGGLLDEGFAVASKDRLYRRLDRMVTYKKELFLFLEQRWKTLFEAQFDILVFDLTSTYVEEGRNWSPKAKRGYSRDGRPDCLQLIIALVITPEKFPPAYEMREGDTDDNTTLRGFLEKIEQTYGKARRVWVMDRGIPKEELLAELRAPDRDIRYLVGTPRGKLRQYEKALLELPWKGRRTRWGSSS
jgi:hypothetical protein